jgi:hypothetical protein
MQLLNQLEFAFETFGIVGQAHRLSEPKTATGGVALQPRPRVKFRVSTPRSSKSAEPRGRGEAYCGAAVSRDITLKPTRRPD